MRVVVEGHVYALSERGGVSEQIVTFARDEMPGQPGSHDGVLCQELIRALIDRVDFLHRQQPCHENVTIAQALRQALACFEARALRRKLEKMPYPDRVPVGRDGHLFEVNDGEPGTTRGGR